MTDAPNTPSPDLQTLTTRLETTLSAPANTEILDQQAQILDQLFTLIIAEKVSPAFSGTSYHGEIVRDWLAFALQIQKQTTATVKAKAAIDYMNTLTAPHHRKLEKQNE